MSDKTPLILLPGLLCTEALWRHQIDALSDIADARVADLTGGESMAAMADSVLAQAPRRFALAGLSMGGYVAQEIMRRAPERVTRLALLDTQAPPDTPERREGRKAQIELARAGRFDEVVEQFLATMLNPRAARDQAFDDAIRGMCRTVGPEAFARQQTAIMNRPDGRADLPRIACQTLILCGREDQATPLEAHEEMAAAIPQARLVVIEDCGHLPAMERPEQVNAAMRDWLRGW